VAKVNETVKDNPSALNTLLKKAGTRVFAVGRTDALLTGEADGIVEKT
jgi:hypothetical protein